MTNTNLSRWSFRKYVLLIAVGLVPFGLAVYLYGSLTSEIRVEKDAQPSFQIDPTQPYEISASWVRPLSGQVSEITVNQDGQVVARLRKEVYGQPIWEEKVFTIPPDARAEILRSVETHGVMGLHRSYTRRGKADEEYETLVIRQGAREKRVECRGRARADGFGPFTQSLWHITEPYQRGMEWQVMKKGPP